MDVRTASRVSWSSRSAAATDQIRRREAFRAGSVGEDHPVDHLGGVRLRLHRDGSGTARDLDSYGRELVVLPRDGFPDGRRRIERDGYPRYPVPGIRERIRCPVPFHFHDDRRRAGSRGVITAVATLAPMALGLRPAGSAQRPEFELLPTALMRDNTMASGPMQPVRVRTGKARREWSVATPRFRGKRAVQKLHGARLESGCRRAAAFCAHAGTEFDSMRISAARDGLQGPVKSKMMVDLGVARMLAETLHRPRPPRACGRFLRR